MWPSMFSNFEFFFLCKSELHSSWYYLKEWKNYALNSFQVINEVIFHKFDQIKGWRVNTVWSWSHNITLTPSLSPFCRGLLKTKKRTLEQTYFLTFISYLQKNKKVTNILFEITNILFEITNIIFWITIILFEIIKRHVKLE